MLVLWRECGCGSVLQDELFMNQKDLKEKTELLAGRVGMYLSSLVVKALPEAMLFRLSQVVGDVVFYSARKRRSRTIENLSFVFRNEKSAQEIRKMAKHVFREVAQYVAETAVFVLKRTDDDKRLIENISIEGAEHLDGALENKKGVICVSAHFGNIMMVTPRLSLAGYPCTMIANLGDNPVVAEMWRHMMTDAGMEWIPGESKIKAVSGSMRWLRNNGILFLYADRNQSDGVYVHFFNRPAGTVEGPALLHVRTGAPILCAFMVRLSGRKYKIIINPPIRFKATGNAKDDVHAITQAFTTITEDFAKRHPEQVWWFRKRWRKHTDRLYPS